jgi:hypothetical protein
MRSLASITGFKRQVNSLRPERAQDQAAASTHPETVTVELLSRAGLFRSGVPRITDDDRKVLSAKLKEMGGGS